MLIDTSWKKHIPTTVEISVPSYTLFQQDDDNIFLDKYTTIQIVELLRNFIECMNHSMDISE